MNERIIKLFMQSVDTNYIPLPIEEHIPSWTEKFAELIVRECANVAHNKQYKHSSAHTTGDCATAIKQHFGVEE